MDADRAANGRAFLLLAGVGFVAHVALVFLTPYPPLMDLPNHMARHWLAARALAGEALPPFYHIEYRVLPNLGGDLFMPLVLQIVDLDFAVSFYLVVTIALYWLGPTVFLLQQGPNSVYLAPFWCVFLFIGLFFWGFINFTMGLGLAFFTLAHHEVISRKGGCPWLPLLIHTALVTLLFFCHLVPWAIYGVLLGCKLIWRTAARRGGANPNGQDAATESSRWWTPWLQAALVSLPSLVFFILYRRDVAGTARSMNLAWSPLWEKLLRMLLVFRGYSLIVDALVLGCWGLGLAALVGPGLKAAKRRWPLLGFGVLLVLLLVMPDRIGSGGELDLRLLPAIVVCLLASLATAPVGRWKAALALVALALAMRVGSIYVAWDRISDRLEAETVSFTVLRPGDRVLPVYLAPEFSKEHPEHALIHWTVISHQTFVPNLLAYRDQQPLRYDPAWEKCRRLPYEVGEYSVTMEDERVRECFDVLWIYDPREEYAGSRPVVIPSGYEKVWEQGRVAVWRRKT